MSKPSTEKVLEFLTNYIATYGIPKRIRTDPGTAFTSKRFKEFCETYFIKTHNVSSSRPSRKWKNRESNKNS